MTVRTMPSRRAFSAASFGLVSRTQVFQSPLSGQTQTLDLGWDYWQASYTLKPMKAQAAGEWRSFLTSLRGRSGRFYGFDPAAECGCIASGAGVAGVPASGTELTPSTSLAPSDSLAPSGTYHPGTTYPTNPTLTLARSVTKGDDHICVTGLPGFDWSAGVNPNYDPRVVCAGVYVQLGDELKMLENPLTAGGCGGSCSGVAPMIRGNYPVGTPVVTTGASVVMRLADDGQAQWAELPGGIFSLSFSAVEAI